VDRFTAPPFEEKRPSRPAAPHNAPALRPGGGGRPPLPALSALPGQGPVEHQRIGL
jgi:hypothetical protein